MRFSFQQRLLVLFLACGVLLALVALQVDREASDFRLDAGWVAHSNAVKEGIARTLGLVHAAESEQRAYLITGQSEPLGAYAMSVGQGRNAARELIASVSDNPAQTARAQSLAQAIEQRLVTLGTTLEAFQRDGRDAAMRIVSEGKGRREMLEVERAAAAMLEAEDALLARRQTEAADSGARMRALTPTAIGLCALVMLAALVTTWREQRRRLAAEHQIQAGAERLAESLGHAQRVSNELKGLSEFAELLQSCRNLDEAREGVRATLATLLPRLGGRLALINPSQNLAAIGAHWGDHQLIAESVFAPDDCWALRRGQAHPLPGQPSGFVCKHVHFPNPDRPEARYLCLPLVAQGGVLGVITFDGAGEIDAESRRLATAAADHLALALANLRLQQDLRVQSIRDPLTGLFNRRYLEASLERELARAQRRQQALAVLMIDIDHFKRFNDTYGHEAGDALLARFGEVMQSHCRGEDIPCRYGGEEFTAILLDADERSASERAEALRAAIAAMAFSHRGQGFGQVTASIGVATYPASGKSPQELLRTADAALYAAKAGGRDRVQLAARDPTPQP